MTFCSSVSLIFREYRDFCLSTFWKEKKKGSSAVMVLAGSQQRVWEPGACRVNAAKGNGLIAAARSRQPTGNDEKCAGRILLGAEVRHTSRVGAGGRYGSGSAS